MGVMGVCELPIDDLSPGLRTIARATAACELRLRWCRALANLNRHLSMRILRRSGSPPAPLLTPAPWLPPAPVLPLALSLGMLC